MKLRWKYFLVLVAVSLVPLLTVPRIEEHMRMRHALGLAQEVQQSLLPQGDPLLSGFDIAGESIYCDETGGDYYGFIEDANRARPPQRVCPSNAGAGDNSAGAVPQR